MRLIAIVPLLCSFVALALSLLCIFAGSKCGYLESADILTLNTSMLGHSILASKSSSSVLNLIENHIKGDINNVVTNMAKELSIHDFYSVHILGYCEGYYTPVAIANGTEHRSKNVTKCSNGTALFYFDPTSVIQNEMKPGINLTDLKWPSAIEDATRKVEAATKAMFIIYCVGVGTVCLAAIGAFFGVITEGRPSALLAFLTLGVASAIASAISVEVTHVINQHGDSVGIAAYRGIMFLGMTWAATTVMLLAAWVWIFEAISRRRKESDVLQNNKEGRI